VRRVPQKPGSGDGWIVADGHQIGAAVRGRRLFAVEQRGETVRRITSGSPAWIRKGSSRP